MKKRIVAILTVAFILTIVAAPKYTVNSPSFKVGVTINNNKQGSNGTATQ